MNVNRFSIVAFVLPTNNQGSLIFYFFSANHFINFRRTGHIKERDPCIYLGFNISLSTNHSYLSFVPCILYNLKGTINFFDLLILTI